MLPDLHDPSLPNVEHDRLAVLERRTARSLAARGLENDRVIVTCQHIVDLASERAAGELAEPPHPPKQLLLAKADAGVHAAARRVPHDVVREQRVDRGHIVGLKRLEQLSDDLFVGVHAIPPRFTP